MQDARLASEGVVLSGDKMLKTGGHGLGERFGLEEESWRGLRFPGPSPEEPLR